MNNVAGLWYVQCIPCERIEVNPSKERAIEHWNNQNAQALKYVNVGKRKPDEYRGGVIPVFRLDEKGRRVQKFRSAMELAKKLGYKTRALESRFRRAPMGVLEIEGIRYVRDKTEAAPTSTGLRSKKQTEE